MFLFANTAEKCFHNALILIDACKRIGIDYDMNALDLTDPNPIAMCLFCAHLYETLPNYIPKVTIDFTGALNETVSKNIKISNPSPQPIMYEAIIIGPNAEHFSLPKGHLISMTPKAKLSLAVNFQGKNLRPGNSFLLLTPKKQGTSLAATSAFCLKTTITELTAKVILLLSLFEMPFLFKLGRILRLVLKIIT